MPALKTQNRRFWFPGILLIGGVSPVALLAGQNRLTNCEPTNTMAAIDRTMRTRVEKLGMAGSLRPSAAVSQRRDLHSASD
jgi:hypothetical protein